mmetsp:Transcript_9508/g.27195  ORF Transcript_9508/g.27195 Transcript_9508/m.27195 type:complete len:216 (-) Transcript_9508:3072-3719(-)
MNKKTLSELNKDIIKEKSNDVIKPQTINLSEETILTIIEGTATKFEISNELALKGIYLLLLRGAANKNTPLNLKVTLLREDGTEVYIRKENILYEYRFATGNNFIRRLAETLATDISKFAEKNELNGDLSQKMNNSLLRRGETPLSLKERAWCNSFNQNNTTLEKETGLKRLPSLLAINLFEKSQKENSPRSPKTAPKKTRKARKNKGGQTKKGK